MRARHTSIAAATWPGASIPSETTGCGALTITSWLPRAGSAVKSSGWASGGGSGAWGASAGYRLGTTRTVQPAVSGPPPFGRTAWTSGGVRSSWPSRNGSLSGSTGSGGVAVRPAPGRVARSPATTVRCPVSGSTRTSGTASDPGVAVDVVHEVLLRLVLALVDEDLLAVAAVVHGRRIPPSAELAQDRLVRVLDARIGHRELAQELPGGVAVVARVDAEEGDLLAEVHGLDLERRELDAARPAPRAPHVDHDGVAMQGLELAPQLRPAAGDDPVGLAVQARQRRG